MRDNPRNGSPLRRPRLAWGGGVLMMVAGPSSNTTGGIDSLTLDADGRTPRPFSLPGTGLAGDATSPDVAWNGTDFVVTWLDGDGRVAAARMTAGGTAVDTTAFVFTTAFDIAQMPRVAVSGGTAQVIYIAASDNYRIHELSLSATGTTTHPPAGLVNAASAQQLLAIGRGDGQTLVVWNDVGNGQDASLQAARVADDGSVLDATAHVLGAFGIQAQRLAGAGFARGPIWWPGGTRKISRRSVPRAYRPRACFWTRRRSWLPAMFFNLRRSTPSPARPGCRGGLLI